MTHHHRLVKQTEPTGAYFAIYPPSWDERLAGTDMPLGVGIGIADAITDARRCEPPFNIEGYWAVQITPKSYNDYCRLVGPIENLVHGIKTQL